MIFRLFQTYLNFFNYNYCHCLYHYCKRDNIFDILAYLIVYHYHYYYHYHFITTAILIYKFVDIERKGRTLVVSTLRRKEQIAIN